MNQWKQKALSAEQLLGEAAQKLKMTLQEVRHKEKKILDLKQTIEFLNAEKYEWHICLLSIFVLTVVSLREQLEDTQQDTIDGFMNQIQKQKENASREIEHIKGTIQFLMKFISYMFLLCTEENEMKLKEYSSKKSGDLEVLHAKFQDVILKKNATISHLKADLAEVNEKMKHLESLIV